MTIPNYKFNKNSILKILNGNKNRYQGLIDPKKLKSRRQDDDNDDNKKCNVKRRAVATLLVV